MTREEISEKAAFLTMQVTLKLTGSGSDMIEAATDEMVKFYRATLEEAAWAQCYWCSKYGPPDIESKLHRISSGGEQPACIVPVIHDLIAALEKP